MGYTPKLQPTPSMIFKKNTHWFLIVIHWYWDDSLDQKQDSRSTNWEIHKKYIWLIDKDKYKIFLKIKKYDILFTHR